MNIIKFVKKVENHVYWKMILMGWFDKMDDVAFLQMAYKRKFRKKLNLESPITFNEKLQWLKLYDHKFEYVKMVDKHDAKEYIANKIGVEYIVPTLGVWNKFEDIDFESLPNEFVLKCTHDSGGFIICKDKNKLNKKDVARKINRSLSSNYYRVGREWPYKNIKPRIIAEPLLKEELSKNTEEQCLTDYKFFCFDGIPKILYISKDTAENPTTDFFDMEFNHLSIKMRDPNSEVIPEKPHEFEKMKEIATVLSEGIPHLRVDFYYASGKLYVGELTFYHCGGLAPITPEAWAIKMGDWIKLPQE